MDFLDDVIASGGKDGVFKLWNENLSKSLKEVTLENTQLAAPDGGVGRGGGGGGGGGAGGRGASDVKGFLSHDRPPINAIDIGTGRYTLVGTRKGQLNLFIHISIHPFIILTLVSD